MKNKKIIIICIIIILVLIIAVGIYFISSRNDNATTTGSNGIMSSSNNSKISWERSENIVTDNNYEVEDIRKSLTDTYKKNYRRELSSGMTLFGPHRDDFCFIMDNNTDMKIYASQGQQKCAVLAYKLSSIPIFKENNGSNPVLLLDDIFSELDLNKRNKLLKYVSKDIQSIITTTDLKNISKPTLNNAVIFKVNDGKVERS